uniref:Uncharacterized protein n=1 Tax=Meloidogyne incognita TaxID=6306 RepID=A0A914NW35_MELIC
MKIPNFFLNILIQFFIYFCQSNEQNSGTTLQPEWECGTDNFTKELAKKTIQLTCPNDRTQINACCINHDSCYDQQNGRKNCDENFCGCLGNATFGNKECYTDGKLFCELVKLFGEPAYKAAGKQKTTTTSSMANDNEGCE